MTIVVAAAAAVACNKVQLEVSPVSSKLTVNASIPATKLAVNAGKVIWTEGDAIAVYNTEGTRFTLTLSEGAGTNLAKFTGDFSGTLATDVAVYPAEYASETKGVVSIPKYVERTDNVNAVMASTLSVDGTSVEANAFHHVMAIVEFTLKDVPAYACAIKVFSKTGAQLNGDYTINEGLNGVSCELGSSEAGTNDRIVWFPYKTAYGADATVKFYIPIAPYSYSDLALRLLDGDEDIIEGTALRLKAMDIKAGDYIAMPTVPVRAQVGTARDKFVKVEGVLWAKGNLRVKEETSYSDSWQAGFNIFEHQWQTAYGERDDITVTEILSEDVNRDSKFFDLFNWGGLGRSCQYNNSGFMSSTTAKFDISGRVFSERSGDEATLNAAELTGDARFGFWDVFSGYNGGVSDAETGTGNPTIYGDIAFWASKGQYRMPTSSEVVKLRTNNSAATGQAGWYITPGGDIIYGVLLTSTPSWSKPSMNITPIEFKIEDLESGLFLPKTGRRAYNNTHAKIRYFNNQCVYWSSTFGSLAEGYETCASIVGWKQNFDGGIYGYTTTWNKENISDVKAGNPIRPVYIPESERK